MATLYIVEPGARLEKEYGRLLVTCDDEVLLRTPLSRVSEVVLIGAAGATTPALLACLDAGIGLTLISSTGRLRGRLVPPAAKNIALRHAQYRRAEDAEFCLQIGRAIVGGKLRNQRTLARRLCRGRAALDPAPLQRITAAIKQVPPACSLDELRGLEGTGARAYFALLRQAVPTAWRAERRARRPPPDPFNALLSLAYALLTQAAMAALEVVGLDPYDGFFHADKYGRAALALDLMEEFRSVIADSVVLTAIDKGIVGLGAFRVDASGARLRPAALRTFIGQFERRLETRVLHPAAGRALSYRQCLEVQARLLRHVVEGKTSLYIPFLTR